MLCKNCSRHVDINKNRCKCGRNPFGADKNNFDVIERILNSEEQDIHNVHINPPNVRDCTKRGGNDGAIYDIDERLEVSIDNGISFEPAPGKVMSGLPAGNYIFRDKENYGLIFNLTVEESKSRSFLIAAIVVSVFLVLVISAGIIGLPKLPSVSLPKDDRKTTSSSTEVSNTDETTEMIVYGLLYDEKQEPYLPVKDENFEEIDESKNDLTNGVLVFVNINSCITDEKSNKYYFTDKYNGYIYSDCLIKQSKVQQIPLKMKDTVSFYKGANKYDNKYDDIPSGDNITYYKGCEKNDMYMVKYKGNIGYILVNPTKQEDTMNEKYYIKYDKNKEYIAMYEEADIDCKDYDKIKPDGNEPIKVTVIGEDGDFYQVKYNGKNGYIYKDNLVKDKQKATSATTTTTTVENIVTQPSTSSYYNNYNTTHLQSPAKTVPKTITKNNQLE